jgi:pimeloyl-ACP methyl ester carboxylesterase
MSRTLTVLALAWAAVAGQDGARAPVRVEVALSAAGEVDLAELVARLAGATGLNLPRPPGAVTLPMTGLAGNLSRQMLADGLGPEVRVAVERRAAMVTIDPALLAPGRRAEWARRLRELAARAEREARRRLNYGMHALKSYRPNDPARPTVCLIHGVNSSSGGFVHMVRPLEEAGYGLVVYDYPFNRSLELSCRQFARDWAAFRRETGEKQPWAIVAHSMGCLVARDYVEGPAYAGDVSTFVMVAPVNQGSHLARTQTLLQLINGLQAVVDRRASDALAHLGDGLGEAAADMLPGSAFLRALNARPRREGVAHHILAGDVGIVPAAARRQIEGQLALARNQGGLLGGLARMAGGGAGSLSDRLDEISDGRGDGCVSVARTKLAGVDDHVVMHANHAELIRAPLLYPDPGPVACMPYLLRWLPAPASR